MGDLTPVSSQDVTKAGVRGVGGIVGSVAIGVVQGIGSSLFGIPGLIIGAVSVILGLSAVKSPSKADKTGGAIAIGAGLLIGLPAITQMNIPILAALATPFAAVSGFLMGAGGLALLGYGIFNIVKFVKGLKSRA